MARSIHEIETMRPPAPQAPNIHTMETIPAPPPGMKTVRLSADESAVAAPSGAKLQFSEDGLLDLVGLLWSGRRYKGRCVGRLERQPWIIRCEDICSMNVPERSERYGDVLVYEFKGNRGPADRVLAYHLDVPDEWADTAARLKVGEIIDLPGEAMWNRCFAVGSDGFNWRLG